MLLREAREAKSDALQQLHRFMRQPSLGFSEEPSSRDFVGLAIGVAVGKTERGYKLAIRATRSSRVLVDRLLRSLTPTARQNTDLVRGIEFAPRRVSSGVSIGHPSIGAGTLGGFVRDDVGRLYILSNQHVLAPAGPSRRGDDIWLPGRIDAAAGKHQTVAKLTKWLPMPAPRKDHCDAAIAAVESPYLDKLRPRWYRGIGHIDPRPVSDIASVRRVVKLGRTTGRTRGRVTAFELDGVEVNIGTAAAPVVVTYNGQIEVAHRERKRVFSQPGDSGSFILDADTLRPLALLHAGGVDAQGVDRTIGHVMEDVLQKLLVRIA